MPSPGNWRAIPSRYRLEASRCRGCGKVTYPARAICPACRGTDHERVRLGRTATVVTATVIRVAPAEFAMEVPYAVAIVETREGARLMAQVVDCDPETVRPGQRVTLEFRLVRQEGHGGILCYGHKVVPEAAHA